MDNISSSSIVWWQNVNGRYLAEAIRTSPTTVNLFVYDRACLGGTYGGNRTITDGKPITLTSTLGSLSTADSGTLAAAATAATTGLPGQDGG